MALSPKDPSSFSRPENCMVTSLQLDLDVDFSKHVLKGTVKIDLERKNESTQSVVSDTARRIYRLGDNREFGYNSDN